MNTLQVGIATVNITPRLGIPVWGYFIDRYAKGVLDELEATALALTAGGKTAVMISVDHLHLPNDVVDLCLDKIEKATNVGRDRVFIASTHTHTGPFSMISEEMSDEDKAMVTEYITFLVQRLTDATVMALADRKPAKMGYIVGQAPERVAYIRRYKMKDGSVMTCPPIDDENIDHPIGTLDQRVNVVRFDREGAESIVLVNYGVHADTINGEMISSDWPGWLRRTLDKALDGVKAVCFIGCEGDVGSTNVHPKDGDMNDTEISFDNEMKSPGMARFVGRALAGTVLQVYDKVKYVDVDSIDVLRKDVSAPANVPDPKDLPLAHKYVEYHEAGRDDLIPYQAMELTTVVAEAIRMCKLENGPEFFNLNLTGLRIGDIAFVGIPGEPFTEIGVGIKEFEGFGLVLPCALVNGCCGYFPMMSAFDEGGYEARSSSYKPGIGELIVEKGKELLQELKDRQ